MLAIILKVKSSKIKSEMVREIKYTDMKELKISNECLIEQLEENYNQWVDE